MRVPKPWTQADLNVLSASYGVRPIQAIADELDRSVPAIWHGIAKYGIKRNGSLGYINSHKCERWQDWEEQYLIEEYATTPTEVIAEKLERTAAAVYCRANYFGLTKTNVYRTRRQQT